VFAIYPLALVPLFIGPPLKILTHVYSLKNLSTVAHREERHRPAPAAEPLGAT
jgi:hypothetical protein